MVKVDKQFKKKESNFFKTKAHNKTFMSKNDITIVFNFYIIIKKKNFSNSRKKPTHITFRIQGHNQFKGQEYSR